MPWHSWRAHKSAQELTTCLSSIRDALPDEEESPKVHSSAEIRAQDQTRAPHVGFKECLNSRVNVTSNSLSTSCKRLNFMIHFNYNLFSVLLSAHDANSCVLCLEKKNFFFISVLCLHVFIFCFSALKTSCIQKHFVDVTVSVQ